MKYIKLFEQQWQQPDQSEELLDFSNDNLAYLVDDGFKIKVDNETSDQYDAIRIRKGEKPFDVPCNRLGFNWEEVKDIFLPFFIRLDRKYEVMAITFFTIDLGRTISFTKDGAAKIQELLDEEKSYDYVTPYRFFDEIKIKIKKLPLIYNRNESFDRWSRDQKNELTEYCETNLAYLIDEGFKIRVGQDIGKNAMTDGKKIIPNPEFHNVLIQITLGALGEKEDFFWDEVKDQIIPFIMRLEKKYDIQKIRFLSDEKGSWTSNTIKISGNFEEKLDNQPFNKVRYIDIFLSDEKEQINESLSQTEEIKDFCDTHLAYLTDDNFSINYAEHYGGNVTELTIKTLIGGRNVSLRERRKKRKTQIFTWDDVKDHFIPFLYMLSKEYKLFNFHVEDYDCKNNEFICFQTFMGSKHYYSYEDVISDNIDTEQFTKRFGLYSIKIKIGKSLSKLFIK